MASEKKRGRSSCHYSCCQELVADQAGDRGVVREDADHVGAALDLLVEPLERFGAPDLAPVLLRKVKERQHVVASCLHHRHGGGER